MSAPTTCYECGGPSQDGIFCIACRMAYKRDRVEERKERRRRRKDRQRPFGERLEDGFSYFQTEDIE